MPNHSDRIAEIREILRSGATTVVNDGVTVTLDPDSLRKELRQLMAEDDVERGRRPVASTINLSRF